MPLFRVSLGLLLIRFLVLLGQGVPLVSFSWPNPFGGRDQWFARDLCGSATSFPSFLRQGIFSVLWTPFPFRAGVLNAGPFPAFSFCPFVCLAFSRIDWRKGFPFRLPASSLSFHSSGGGSISFSPLSLFSSWSLVSFSAFPLLLAYGHCKSGAREPPILWAVWRFFLCFWTKAFFLASGWVTFFVFHFFLCLFLWEVLHLFY